VTVKVRVKDGPSRSAATLLLLAAIATGGAQAPTPSTRQTRAIENAGGVQLFVATENDDPTLRVALPGHSASDGSIVVLFPEHVTAVRHGSSEGEQLYLWRPGLQSTRAQWRTFGQSLEYERDLARDVHLLARATLEADGVRFHYELTNRSAMAFDMITAVTDPRMQGILHDVRLARTYIVQHYDGFELLASETPERLTMPLDRWLPARYLASVNWPVPKKLVERRDDGITYYNRSRGAEAPFIATRSTDGKWVVASFTREAGNVWSNPELTCQHVDPQTPLAPGQRTTLEVKMLVMRGSLDDALHHAIREGAGRRRKDRLP